MDNVTQIKLNNKIRVGYILPCDLHNFKIFRNLPINALYLLTILEHKFGNSVDLSLIDLRCVGQENAIYCVPEKDIYLYSIATINYPETVRMVHEIRKVYPLAKHVTGGIHADIYPNESLEVFDAIALGEGENNVVNIVKDASELNLKRIYREDKLMDINLFSYPSRKYLPRRAVADIGHLNGKYIDLICTAVLFSRGCPFKCDFCANLVQSKPRFRAPELIVEEIEYLKKEYGIQALAIKDDNIISWDYDTSKKTLLAIRQTNVKWRGNCRANNIPDDIVALAKESGCVDLAIGIESVSQNVLNNINKKLDLDKAKEFLKILKKNEIGARINLILGLPGEPKDIAKKIIEFIKEMEPSSVLLTLLTPVPGSEIFKNPKKFGIKLDPDIPFEKLFPVFGRFNEEEKPYMVFEYDKVTPFGESMTNEEIINNYMEIQSYLRENKLNF